MSQASEPAATANVLNGPEELHMDFQPVLRLALWAHDHHEPVRGQCKLCGPAPCQPYTDSSKILMAAGPVPYMIVSGREDADASTGCAAA
jgi:hypothetical protein